MVCRGLGGYNVVDYDEEKELCMSPIEWYYARENKQMGPVSSLELKRLATAGELRPGDLVWREGMTEWSLASNVRGLFDGEAKAVDSGLKIGEPAGAAPAAAAPAAVAAPAPTAAPQRRGGICSTCCWIGFDPASTRPSSTRRPASFVRADPMGCWRRWP